RVRGWEGAGGALRDGLAPTRWPGRLEVIDRNPIVLVDGAHNPAGLERSLAALQKLTKGRPIVIFFGAIGNKNFPRMLPCPPAASPTDLAAQFHGQSETAESSAEALNRARERAGRDGIVFVCGSLYLGGGGVGRAKDRGRQRPAPVRRR